MCLQILGVLLLCLCAQTQVTKVTLPPKGWNSYDSYLGNVDEEAFLANCAAMKAKLGSQYEYCVIDYYWYYNFTGGHCWIDQYGRPVPAADKWPSTAASGGFKPIADKVHAMGLKFGFHVMRGISKQALDQNTPIKGTNFTAKDITLTTQACPWSKSWYGVDTSKPAGQAFYQSLADQFAEWDTDFIKNDCVFGIDFLPNDIETFSNAFQKSGKQIVYSLSPGDTGGGATGSERAKAQQINKYVNMYRVTDDDWDSWGHGHLQAHFAVGETMGNLSRNAGLNGNSFIDMDMLPFGNLSAQHGPTIGKNGYKIQGSHEYKFRPTQLTKPEQKTQMTMWAMVNSPFFMGGELLTIDPWTVDLLTNSDIMEIDNQCANRRTVKATGFPNTTIFWMCDATVSQSHYLAAFNTAEFPVETVIDIPKVSGLMGCAVYEVFQKDHPCGGQVCSRYLDRHDVLLLRLDGC